MVPTRPSPPGSGPLRLLRQALRLLPLLALGATPAVAQIFKCTADSGEVTYQNEACPKKAKAEHVDIFDNSWTADRAEKDAQWQRTAAQRHVVAGMPLRWVREALGEPSEIRDAPTAGATQVWVYSLPDRSVQVGILADRVLWSRETPLIAAPPRIAPETDHAAGGAPGLAANAPQVAVETPRPAADAPRAAADAPRPAADAPRVAADTPRAAADAPRAAAELPRVAMDTPRLASEGSRPAQLTPKVSDSRRGVARGQDCKQALAELGTPDRQREVPALDAASAATTEYFYEPGGSENPMRTRIVCANGKVEGVDHAVLR